MGCGVLAIALAGLPVASSTTVTALASTIIGVGEQPLFVVTAVQVLGRIDAFTNMQEQVDAEHHGPREGSGDAER